ncbi:MAG: hypothetical protein OSA86_00325 [Acidimicrobiales bacterium]|nr:hypothetical protein [Acidimicrobiales bacterium]
MSAALGNATKIVITVEMVACQKVNQIAFCDLGVRRTSVSWLRWSWDCNPFHRIAATGYRKKQEIKIIGTKNRTTAMIVRKALIIIKSSA